MTKGDRKAPGVRKFIVEADTVDKDGNVLADESYSTGGAREANGRKISEYRNPIPYDPEDSANHEFYARLNSEYEAKQRREEYEAQAAHDKRVRENVEFVLYVWNATIEPRLKAYWELRGRDDAKRFGRWLSKPFRRGSNELAVDEGEDPAEALVSERNAEFKAAAHEMPESIARLDVYRERRDGVPSADIPADPQNASTA